MKSRLAITAILVLGLLMSGTGATLALSGSSESGSAAKAQYPDTVLPQQEGTNQGGGAVLGANEGGGTTTPGTQATRQVAASKSGESLPFTGLAAIPIVLLGLGLMGGGALLHRSARRSES